MAITKMEGGTFRMLSKDKRVDSINHSEDGTKVLITLAAPWAVGLNEDVRSTFENWESARNWVRKAVEITE